MRVRIRHVSRYTFDRPAVIFPHTVRLHPAPHTRTRVLAYNLGITPETANVRWLQDPWGNRIARLTMPDGKLTPELQLHEQQGRVPPEGGVGRCAWRGLLRGGQSRRRHVYVAENA